MRRLRDRVHAAQAEGRGCVSVYLPLGYPDLATSEAAIGAAIEAGADWVELGIPFSDPAADGPVIEAATAAAIKDGFRVEGGLAAAARIRAAYPGVPLYAMTYANIAYQMGWDGFAAALVAAGIDGCILPDIPLEESTEVRAALAAAGIEWVPLVTPTTSEERMAAIAATATGFLYVVSNVGITGQGDPGPLVEATVQRARAAGATVPLAVGFGIRTGDDVARVLASGADAAIVGSHLVARLSEGGPEAVAEAVRGLRGGA